MERLTEKFKDGRNILRKGITDIFHVGFGRFFEGEAVDKLAEYEDLEEQGKLLKLPCAVGDAVYCIYSRYTKCSAYNEEFEESSCLGCESECDSRKEYYVQGQKAYNLDWIVTQIVNKHFGKLVFITQEEAEAALKELEKRTDMRQGIKEKDIRDFVKYAEKLNDVIVRTREYCPEAQLYLADNTLHLLNGPSHEVSRLGIEKGESIKSVKMHYIGGGDW